MTADAKPAVAWLRRHAGEMQVRPDRIVLSGGSVGGHLTLLTAYAHEDATLTPADLSGADPAVSAVVALYCPADLAAM